MKHVSPGDPLRIDSRDWNAIATAVETVDRQRHDRGETRRRGGRAGAATVAVRNGSPDAVPANGILALAGPVVGPAADLDRFRFDPVLDARRAWAPDAGRFVVTLAEAAAGDVVEAVVAGVVAAPVRIVDEADTRADVDPGRLDRLLASPTGSADIVWKQPAGERPDPSLAWCLVRLGAGSAPASRPGRVYAYTLIDDLPNEPYVGCAVQLTDEAGNVLAGEPSIPCRVASYDSATPTIIGRVQLGQNTDGTYRTAPHLGIGTPVRVALVNGLWWIVTPNWVAKGC